MNPEDAAEIPVRDANLSLAIGGTQVDLSLAVPDAPVRTRRLLPVLQTFTSAICNAVERNAANAGRTISCKAGCGACCRQLVPIAAIEAFHIRDLVESLPEPRRTAVKQRFAENLQRAEEAGLGKTVRAQVDSKALAQEEAMRYFHMGMPCPFLEEESCSIHLDRPLSCREYIVSNDPIECTRPGPENIQTEKMPGPLWTSLAALDYRPGTGYTTLTYALKYAEDNEEPDSQNQGTETFERFLRRFLGR